MYLCICKSVSDRQVREAVERGARSFGALSIRLGVGIDCGKCVDSINEVLRECLNQPPSTPVAVAIQAGSEVAAAAVPAAPAPPRRQLEPAPERPWFAVDL